MALPVPQVFDAVYRTVSAPVVMPVTMPAAETVAIPVPDVPQTPPVIVVPRLKVAPVHTVVPPVMVPDPGTPFT